MSEHRKNKRHLCLVPVEGKSGSVFDNTQTVDLSKGGMGFVSPRKIPVNKEIPIELDMTIDGEPVFVIGKVCWVTRMADSKNYRIGVFFKDVMQGSKSRLNQYFKELT
jgi:Tfp pilus assembly protein PilZ